MRNRKIIFAVLMLIGASTFMANAQEREQLTVPLSDPARESKLNVSLVTGSIKVVGYDGKDIMIDAIAGNKGERTSKKGMNINIDMSNDKGNTDGMKRISTNDGFELIAKEKNNVVNVSVDKVNTNINITVKVPRKTSLKLSTVNNGDIWVENVNGNLEVSNINGEIRMKNVAGSVLANTINQDIVVNFTDVTPNTPMAFTTLNGDVDVTFPPTIKANVKLKTERGGVYTDFDIDVDKNPAKVNQTSDKERGLYKITKDEWTYGKINAGGSEIMMKTMNGNIYVRKK